MKIVKLAPLQPIEVKKIPSSENKVELEIFYKEINCSCIDAVYFPFGIIGYIDDEGLLKDNIITEITLPEGEQIFLAGTIVLLGDDGKGGDIDITTEQLKYISKWDFKYLVKIQ